MMNAQAQEWRKLKLTEDLIRQVQTDIQVAIKHRAATRQIARDTVLEFMCEVTRLMMTATDGPMSVD